MAFLENIQKTENYLKSIDKKFEVEIETAIKTLEEIADALENHSYNREAEVVLGHVQQLRNPGLRNQAQSVFLKQKVPAGKYVEKMIEGMASSFLTM